MTIVAAFLRRRFVLPRAEERCFQVDADSRLLGHCHWQEGKDRAAPVLVLVHGLEGSSASNYMLGIGEKAWTERLTPTLYNSGMSSDYRAVFDELSSGDGFSRIFFAGYSMGGNLVTKMAGEFGEAVPAALRGVAAICPAINLGACADALERRNNYFYQRHFVTGLMSRYARKVELFPQRYSPNGFGRIGTVREFDDAITAPQFGYSDAQEYYEAAGAKCVIDKIRVPLLLITAQDDPFVPFEATRASGVEKNPAIVFNAPEHGGHCGFISDESGSERFWAEQRVVEFCAGLADRS